MNLQPAEHYLGTELCRVNSGLGNGPLSHHTDKGPDHQPAPQTGEPTSVEEIYRLMPLIKFLAEEK